MEKKKNKTRRFKPSQSLSFVKNSLKSIVNLSTFMVYTIKPIFYDSHHALVWSERPCFFDGYPSGWLLRSCFGTSSNSSWDIWPIEAIEERIRIIESGNKDWSELKWIVVESLPVHEDIKKGLPTREKYIENYKTSLRNLAACGIETVCYNFMPVLDWSRTKLYFELANGSTALRFVWVDFAIFDLFILKRPKAIVDYTEEVQKAAKERFEKMSQDEINELKNTALLGLPGSNEAFHLENFQSLLDNYQSIGANELEQNLYYFIQSIAPFAESLGIKLCIHPDDPPFPLLGLPRVVSTEKNLADLMDACPVNANGITFCTGSLGVRSDNDLPHMIRRFADRIHFVHLRATKREQENPLIFHEADHLTGDVPMVEVIKEIVTIEKKYKKQLPMRPDHGHQMLDDLQKKTYPGYTGIGRLKGLAELRGVELAVKSMLCLLFFFDIWFKSRRWVSIVVKIRQIALCRQIPANRF